jgi:hypothetical protein
MVLHLNKLMISTVFKMLFSCLSVYDGLRVHVVNCTIISYIQMYILIVLSPLVSLLFFIREGNGWIGHQGSEVQR